MFKKTCWTGRSLHKCDKWLKIRTWCQGCGLYQIHEYTLITLYFPSHLARWTAPVGGSGHWTLEVRGAQKCSFRKEAVERSRTILWIWGWYGEAFPDVLNTWCPNVASCMNMLQDFTPRHLPLWNSWFLCWYRFLKHNYIRILMHNLSLDPNAGEPFWAASYNGLVEWVRRPSNELSVLRRLRKRNQQFVEEGPGLLIESCTSSSLTTLQCFLSMNARNL